AILTALKAGRQVKQLLFPPDELQKQVTETLRTVFYSAHERDRWTWSQGEAKKVFVTSNKQVFLTTSGQANQGTTLLNLQNNTLPIRSEMDSKVIFSPQGDKVAFIELPPSNNSQILLFNWNGEPLAPPMEAADATFTPNGELLLIKNDDFGNVLVLNQQNQWIDKFEGIGQQQILGYDFNSHQLVTSTASESDPDDDIIQVWGKDGSRQLLQSQDPSGMRVLGITPENAVFSSNGKTLLILGYNINYSDFEFWQYEEFCDSLVSRCWLDNWGDTASSNAAPRSDSAGILGSVDVVNPNYGSNKELVAVAIGETISLLNENGLLINELGGSIGRLIDVTFSPDGRLLATVGDDRFVRLWDLQSSQPKKINEFNSQITQIRDVDLSNDGKYLAIVDENGSSRLWAIQEDEFNEIRLAIQEINAIAFSPDGQSLATAGKDGFIRIWNLQGAKKQEFNTKLATAEGTEGIRDIIFTPDGQSILVDETLWSLSDHSQVAALRSSVASKPTGESLYVVEQEDGGGSTFLLKNLEGVSLAEFQ
ncbi:MAG TPA: WD40 repeat domain-containing protein, partial [Phormidium sp.]